VIEPDNNGTIPKHKLTVWNSAAKPVPTAAQLFAAEKKLAYATIGKFVQANPQLVVDKPPVGHKPEEYKEE
jgi:hypothetical protein